MKKLNQNPLQAIHEDETCDEYRVNRDAYAYVLGISDSAQPPAVSDVVISNNNSNADLAATDELFAIIPNAEPFACPICLTEYEPGFGVMLRQCLHCFCQNCLRNHINHSTDVQIKCPFVEPDNQRCEYNLLPREIKALLSDAEHEKYLDRSLQLAESIIRNTFHCLTADCSGWCVVEDNVAEFLCGICYKPNCLACQVIHEGQTCENYIQTMPAYQLIQSNDLSANALEVMLKDGTAMKCTGCDVRKTIFGFDPAFVKTLYFLF
jgi:RING-type zinc-finger